MKKETEKDFLWDTMMHLREKFGYPNEMVVSDKGKFQPFIMIVVPVRKGAVGYMNINAIDLCNSYEMYGEKKTLSRLDEMVEQYLIKMRRKFGDI